VKAPERASMSKNVQVPQRILFVFGGLLLVSLVATGYLLGKQSLGKPAEPSPSPVAVATPIPLVGEAEQSLDARIDALEGRVGALHQKADAGDSTEAPPENVPQPPAGGDAQAQDSIDLEARRAYFEQLDAILGSSALASPQPIATRLLEQGMSGDDRQLDAVIIKTSQAVSDVKAAETPLSCQEHKDLVLGQLSHTVALLREVQAATQAGDTAKLNSLPLPDDQIMGQALRLQELDRSLRP
jgi:hypothetical protein